MPNVTLGYFSVVWIDIRHRLGRFVQCLMLRWAIDPANLMLAIKIELQIDISHASRVL